jgi:hypothetical protein
MKTNSILILIITTTFLFSCEKEKVPESTKDISGQWRWIYSWIDSPLSDSNPRTPQNTGIQEIMNYNTDHTWLKIQNSIHVDSGTFATGHGSWSPTKEVTYVYDSIVYYKNGDQVKDMPNFYNIYGNDTLVFSGIFRGLYAKSAKGDPTEGASKFYIRLK